MKRIFLLFTLVVFILGNSGVAEIVSLTILHTNDFHAHLLPDEKGQGGAARIAGYFKHIRQHEKQVLILDAGDMISGTPVSSMFKGEPIFRVLDHWGIDASILGNHEFDYGWDRIERYREITSFPILCANAYVTESDGMKRLIADAEYKIFTFGALRVAVIAVIAEWTPRMTVKEAVRDVLFLPSIPTLKRLVPIISKQADLVIVLSHVGFEHDRKIAAEVEGINCIIGAHSHTLLKEIQKVNGVPIVQAGEKGLYVGKIDLTADTERDTIVELSYQVLPVNENLAKPDPETENEVRLWEDRAAEIVDRDLGEATENLSKNDLILLAETAFLEATGADYAFQNRGGTRGGIAKGPFSYRTIWNIFPFENTLVTTRIEGNKIPPNFFGKTPIEPDREYSIVTNSFVRDQWTGLFPAYPRMEWTDTGIFLRESINRYLEREKRIGWVRLVR